MRYDSVGLLFVGCLVGCVYVGCWGGWIVFAFDLGGLDCLLVAGVSSFVLRFGGLCWCLRAVDCYGCCVCCIPVVSSCLCCGC